MIHHLDCALIPSDILMPKFQNQSIHDRNWNERKSEMLQLMRIPWHGRELTQWGHVCTHRSARARAREVGIGRFATSRTIELSITWGLRRWAWMARVCMAWWTLQLLSSGSYNACTTSRAFLSLQQRVGKVWPFFVSHCISKLSSFFWCGLHLI